MRLYIANPTRQEQVVCYRIDIEDDGTRKDTNRRFQPARQQPIGPGLQAQLGSDMHKAQIDDIVKQLRPYGLIHMKDQMPNKKVPYVYSIDVPVPADFIRRVQFHNGVVATEDGRKRREDAAIGTNQLVQDTVAHHFAANQIPATPADTTLVTTSSAARTG